MIGIVEDLLDLDSVILVNFRKYGGNSITTRGLVRWIEHLEELNHARVFEGGAWLARLKDGQGCGSIELIFRVSIHYGQSRSDSRLAINMACSLLETKTLFGKVILLTLNVLGHGFRTVFAPNAKLTEFTPFWRNWGCCKVFMNTMGFRATAFVTHGDSLMSIAFQHRRWELVMICASHR
jgi:hypothetical protein